MFEQYEEYKKYKEYRERVVEVAQELRDAKRAPGSTAVERYDYSVTLAEEVAAEDLVYGVFHECACGEKYNIDAWTDCEYVGPMDDGDGGFLELRNCKCGSTMAAELGKARPDWSL